MKTRQFTNGESISVIGFGGILVSKEPQTEADRIVANAIDAGINYFDVAPTYGDAQSKLGPALKGKRNGVFLACKTVKRTADEAQAELEASLKLLQTDRFDLYQLHGLNTMEDVETIMSPSGAMKTFLQAREKGLIRYIGFSAHSQEAACAIMDRFDFDSALFPVNWVCHFTNGFGKKIMQKAIEKRVARLALKAMAQTVRPEGYDKYPKAWYRPIEDEALAKLALRYTLSQDVTAAVTPGEKQYLQWAIEVGQEAQPITDEELLHLQQKSVGQTPIFE